MAYQIKRITELKGVRKGIDVLVDFGFMQKTLYFSSQKVFDAEFPERMMKAELNIQADLAQEAYDKLHPNMSREDFEKILLNSNYIAPGKTIEDLPTKSKIWASMADYSTSGTLTLWNKIFGTTLVHPSIELEVK